ncbi:hypothetical protein [Ancylobacter radicis]|uniref:Oxidoreductase n=1 Tax=Ancylobacter radicis TaxID=2836179 RepID=A0ABS5RG64_9HYPH|nr:hypothetical protein [Ancylobacter radicis]MBS9479337.1 hypothetical protein [Ancylobacter radicis]
MSGRMRAAFLLLGFLIGAGAYGPADAHELVLRWVTPSGTPLEQKTLTLEQIDKLKQSAIHTHTPWTQGLQDFSGPSLGELAGLAGRRVSEAKVVALNDYSATVPASDWTEAGAILSTRHNGRQMRIREKGPFWVMYPIDSDPDLAHQLYQARMVWQVKSIDFVTQ